MFTAPNTDPVVTPTPPIQQGGIWTAIGGLLGVLVDFLPTLPIPEAFRPWVPFIGAVLGYIVHTLAGPAQYHPTPPPKAVPPAAPADIDARLAKIEAWMASHP